MSTPTEIASAAAAKESPRGAALRSAITAFDKLSKEDCLAVLEALRIFVDLIPSEPTRARRRDAGKPRGSRTTEAAGSAPLLEGNPES